MTVLGPFLIDNKTAWLPENCVCVSALWGKLITGVFRQQMSAGQTLELGADWEETKPAPNGNYSLRLWILSWISFCSFPQTPVRPLLGCFCRLLKCILVSFHTFVLMQKYLVTASALAHLIPHPLLTFTFFDGKGRKCRYTNNYGKRVILWSMRVIHGRTYITTPWVLLTDSVRSKNSRFYLFKLFWKISYTKSDFISILL